MARKFRIKVFDPKIRLAALLLLIMQISGALGLLIWHIALFNWRLFLRRQEILTKAEVLGLSQG